MRDETIERLRKSLSPLLTLRQYCKLMHRSERSAYNDLRNKPELAVKVGRLTRIFTDAVLDELARAPMWTPQKDRAPKTKVTPSAKSPRLEAGATRTPRRCAHDSSIKYSVT
jgi:hypothetical protein